MQWEPNILDKNVYKYVSREQHWSIELLQLTGRWRNDGIIWLALRPVKSIIVEFLNQNR